MIRQTALLLLAASILQSCMLLREDHALTRGWSQRLGKLEGSIVRQLDPAPMLRRVNHMFGTGGDLAGSEVRRLGVLPSKTKSSLGREMDRLRDLPSESLDLVGTVTTALPKRLRHIADTPGRVLGKEVSRLNKLRYLGDTLRLNQQIMPMPGDPSRETSLEPRQRRASFWERIFARIRP